ncbi:MAG: DUF4345 domain-containing protein [Siphonobacter sp.]
MNKSLSIFSKDFILLSAFGLLSVSLMAFHDPQSVMNLVQVKLPNPDAYSSIRGIYGGAGLAIVITLLDRLRKNIREGLCFLCLFWGLYALSRVITIYAEGTLGSFGTQWFIIESICFITSAVLVIVTQNKTEVARL